MSNQSPFGILAVPRSDAQFIRCALQTNPFSYVQQYKKKSEYSSENAYNVALVAALKESGVDVIGITDHFRCRSAHGLREAAVAAGIHVFPGFEAVTREGVHLLCLFDPSETLDRIDRYIGSCGVIDESEESPVASIGFDELIQKCGEEWNGVCVAAHVCAGGGLLNVLTGKPAIRAWQNEHLLACATPGPVDAVPVDKRQIVANKNKHYHRPRAIAVINASDISGPDDIDKPGGSCLIKMTRPTVEALRQAFLDPESRVRLDSDEKAQEHSEITGISWSGGFLDGNEVRFGPHLNVLVGGRGSGKSTVIESLRFVAGRPPSGRVAMDNSRAFVDDVLGEGTTVTVVVTKQQPNRASYAIARTVGEDARVYDEDGMVTNLTAADVVEPIAVYGQHEIADLARMPAELTRLLDQFMTEGGTAEADAERDLKGQLKESRRQVLRIIERRAEIEDKVDELPGLVEARKRYIALGLSDKLRGTTDIVEEEGRLDEVRNAVGRLSDATAAIDESVPIDFSPLTSRKLGKLGGKDVLSKAVPSLKKLNLAVRSALTRIHDAIDAANGDLDGVQEEWELRKATVNDTYYETIRTLKQEGIDGRHYRQVLKRIRELQPLKQQLKAIDTEMESAVQRRQQLLGMWQNHLDEKLKRRKSAAKKVTRGLRGIVSMELEQNGDRGALFEIISELKGRKADIVRALEEQDSINPVDLAADIRTGVAKVTERYGMAERHAKLLCDASEDLIMRIEEVELATTSDLWLNVARPGDVSSWKSIDDLSTGQKATAVLMLMLMKSSEPLVIDQPEDDLDNRFISEVVVPKLRAEKHRRQFVLSSHNANIPVLGDAELIIGLESIGATASAGARIPLTTRGSIDSPAIQALVTETLEGGKTAFETRRLKYNF